MKRLLQNTLAAACILVSGGALAADFPPTKAPPLYAPVLPGWSGWIVSVIAGGDFNNVNFNLGGTPISAKPSAFAIGGMSELIYMFSSTWGIEHKLMFRYADPSLNFGVRGLGGVGAPYYRVDSFGEIVFSPDPHWKLDAGIGAAAQTQNLGIFNTGIHLQNYGLAANAGIEVKPFIENHNNLAFSVNFIYENMNGFQIANLSNGTNNFGVVGGIGWEFQ